MNLLAVLKEANYKLQLKARQHIGNKIYFLGPPHVGKTTLVEELRKRQGELYLSDDLKNTRRRYFTFWEALSGIEYTVFDGGGEDEFRVFWFETLNEQPPIGIVFVIDHEQNQASIKDLKQVFGALENIKRERPTMAITRGILVFINKYDLWNKKLSPREIIAPIQNEISKFELIGITPIIRWGSAQYYKKYSKYLDASFLDFHRLLFDPLTKIPKWPTKA